MKKFVVVATSLIALVGFAAADIQAPPGSQYTSSRKLGRALSNMLYGFMEIPSQMTIKEDELGRKAAWSFGVVEGTNRALRRFGYGFYELITFTCPTYRGTYKQPYERCGEDNRIQMNVADGLSEFPPELGFVTYYRYGRAQSY
ncbi:MAG: exosortase system-associated protein, TIGR04073 family [Verrucomicrobia bacterium]|nr:MAG: exosortase system-associated protein, TIGR04073 family [Verrucomicrobiota bacterium]